MEKLDGMFLGAYDILGRLEDVPLTTEFSPCSRRRWRRLTGFSIWPIKAGSVGYRLGSWDHASTTPVPTAERRQELAQEGRAAN